MKRFIIFLLWGMVAWPISGICGPNGKPLITDEMDAIKLHYDYLEKENQNLKEAQNKEREQFLSFVQKEREAHQSFLENTYRAVGIVVSVITLILGFIGWNTFKGIDASRKNLETSALAKLALLQKEFDIHSTKIEDAKQQMKRAEQDYQRFLEYYKNANPRKGRYLFVGSEKKLSEMKEDDLIRFTKAFDSPPEYMELENKDFEVHSLIGYDLIVYRSNVDTAGEDKDLIELVRVLKDIPDLPLVLYAKNNSEFTKGTTEIEISELGLLHRANSQVTLIDNVASTYRVAKMLPRNKPSNILT